MLRASRICAKAKRNDGHHHQHVDIERHHACGCPRASSRVGAAVQNRDGEDSAAGEHVADQPLKQKTRRERCARHDDQHLSNSGRRACPNRLLVLEPRTHSRLGDGLNDGIGGELCRVIAHAETLANDIGHQVLEPWQACQPTLEDRHLFTAIHAIDLEDRLRMNLANGALLHT
jgi:hypothetical protein